MPKLFITRTYRNCVISAIFTLTSCLISSFAYATCQTINSTTVVNTSNICTNGNAVEIIGGANPSVTISSGTTQSVSDLFTWAVHVNGNVNTLTNNGTITNSASNLTIPLNIERPYTVTSLINAGVISNTQSGGYSSGLRNQGTIGTLTNTGTITAVDAGHALDNYGTISVLNNSQGAGNASGPLQLSSNLPLQYNIIINSPTQYGQLIGISATGSTTFGIYTGSSVSARTYTGVLQGLSSGNLTTTVGTYSGYSWTLVNSAGTTWDLILALLGPSAADTQQSLVNSAAALQNTYALQSAVLANSFSYDCSVFGANNICVSAGGRNTAVSAANGLNNTSALLIAAYRIKPTFRIGAYADQNLSVNNAGSTVNLGNSTPLIGLFGVWNQRLDGTGTEVKVSAAYGQKNTTVNRQVVGTSEAGNGSSNLNSQGAQITAKYGFAVAPEVLVSPYVGVRYTQNNMGGYTESASATVTAPLTYSALNTNATTALAGVTAAYRFIPNATAFASAGVETDTNTSNGTYSATGVTGLTPVNFNPNPVKTRPTATLGAYYDIVKNQRIGITGIYRQESYQAISTTTVMATYTIGL
jgi:hypothetical protein